MSDLAIAAAYGRAWARTASSVTFQRVTGIAPNATVVSAEVLAIVRNYNPDTETVARTGVNENQNGAITQGYRQVLVLEQDLAAQGFPLPLKKNDRVVLASGDRLNIEDVDAEKRQLGGAIELKASGVA